MRLQARRRSARPLLARRALARRRLLRHPRRRLVRFALLNRAWVHFYQPRGPSRATFSAGGRWLGHTRAADSGWDASAGFGDAGWNWADEPDDRPRSLNLHFPTRRAARAFAILLGEHLLAQPDRGWRDFNQLVVLDVFEGELERQ